MPACAPEYGRLARSNTELVLSPRVRRCPHQPLPVTALRRSFSSTFSLIPEERAVPAPAERPTLLTYLFRLLTWGPRLMFRVYFIFFEIVFHPAWRQIFLVLPTLWAAAALFIFWKFVQCPIVIMKLMFSAIYTAEKPRTVLISGGSTVQALHLARNFHSLNARVVAFEIEGHFSLLKYSAAVDNFYTIPRPNPADPFAYARALREIVRKESISFYVPVNTTTSAYYDALAKPLLEMLGCTCFVPYARDVVTLDDPVELMRISQAAGLPTPQHWIVTSHEDVHKWYESGAARHGKHFIASAGARGARDRLRFILPDAKCLFRFTREISADKPWLIVREPKGEKILTCTTLKESRCVNNITCRMDTESKVLLPQKDEEVDACVQRFVSCMAPSKPMTGHVSFRLVREEPTSNGISGRLVPVICRVGVSMSYLCQEPPGRCSHKAAVGKLLDTVLDTREALFVYWDPLPYCAYYQSRREERRRPLSPEPCKTPPNVPL